VEGATVDLVVAVAHDRAVDLPGDNQDERVGGCLECPFDAGGVEQAESDIQRLAITSVGIIVDLPRMQDDADP
jgi:hypothetical protein